MVRSSTTADDDGRWAGAFASYLDVGRELLPVAVRGCWASVFSRDVLARCEQVGSAVERRARRRADPAVGAVRRRRGGRVRSRGRRLGHVGGREGRRDWSAAGGPAAPSVWIGTIAWRSRSSKATRTRSMVRAVARLARATFDATGHDCVEWGWTDGQPGAAPGAHRRPAGTDPPPRPWSVAVGAAPARRRWRGSWRGTRGRWARSWSLRGRSGPSAFRAVEPVVGAIARPRSPRRDRWRPRSRPRCGACLPRPRLARPPDATRLLSGAGPRGAAWRRSRDCGPAR